MDETIAGLLNAPMSEKKKKLSKEDLAECERLKKIWESRKRELGLSQEALGALLGVSQGAVTQYLNGHTKIGDLMLYKFAFHIGFDPEEVKPGFYRQHPELMPNLDALDSEEVGLIYKLRSLRELDSSALSRLESLLDVLEPKESA